MKTNHRRKNKPLLKGLQEKYGADRYCLFTPAGGPNYSGITSRALIRNGCSPNYTGRDGARKAIAGRKKKEHRAERHAADHRVRMEAVDE
jgi:hypothetical protein